jgi:hypothetical protein
MTSESDEPDKASDALSWHDFIELTYGSCAELGLERHEQGEYEQREPLN